ncbi:pyruvate dehydrogenase complex dihydrolipoamide acetyltransferase [Flavobacterium gelidilacus]|uniref:pyruvate dehydrogenase complex dihydrolipoamide acetyltransferase n=1 Tax=Flavobacterium gelidilacus TaxID=206041 RepID=UPI0004251EA7|nr:pyruvate dehydrogenase complex dihydrolipoamide acetyltransferase [Flavobacterium gelidilacus]
MATVVTMPRLSDTMTEGTVATWLKKVGDKISEGDILAEIETDKATMEFESFNEGTLLHIGIQEGETATVDSLLAIIGEEGEDIAALIAGGASNDKKDESKAEEKSASESEPKSAELPKGVKVVKMPRLSDTMTTGTVATWLKKVGDKVSEGDILAEIETDKATMEFESFNEGTLLYIGIQEGETAPVDTILAIIGPEGTDVSGIAENFSNDTDTKEEVKDVKTETKTETTASHSSSTNNAGGRIFASPLAKQIAKEKGIDLNQIVGSGENGRIVKSDVENYVPSTNINTSSVPETVAQDKKETVANVQPFVPVGEKLITTSANSQMRKTIARRLGESKFTAPHYYLTIELDMDNAIASRTTINSLPDTKVSFNDLIVKACAMALKKHPRVNSQWTEKETILNHHVNIGVAVAVEDGLLVPVLPFTDQMSLTQISSSVKDLAGKAKAKKLSPAEMEGSTFTISNLGAYGIIEFTSIINQPNSAILSIGAIVEKPVVKNSQIVVGNVMKVTLACDHRTVDGATGALFLQTLKSYLENPVTMLA